MSSSPQSALPAPRGVWALVIALGLAGIALLLRSIHLADFFTVDEAYHWIGRVRDFSTALLNQRWIDTDLTGHPGVTTMWLGSIGRWLAHLQGIPDDKSSLGATTAYLATLRLPLAIFNSLTVGVGYLLLRRLVTPWVALLAGILWATSPFLIAFSRLLHVDGVLTSCTTLSVLLLLVALHRSPRLFSWALVGSGICAGLAVLSKSSGLVLLPWAGLWMLTVVVLREWRQSDGTWLNLLQRRWLPIVRQVFGRYLLWLGIAALTFCLLWPAMWVAPLATFGDVLHEISSNGEQPHASGNYFLGKPVDDPGPLFYPVVVLWRSTPFTLIGLLLSIGFGLVAAWRTLQAVRRDRRMIDPSGEGLILWGVASFALLFLLIVSMAAKKFDRYLLPAWPPLEILAAFGLVTGAMALGRQLRIGQLWGRLAVAGTTLLLLGQALFYAPFYLSYYNPMLGGGAVAERIMLIGWGEGMEQLGAWLQARPDLDGGPVLSWIPPTLQPFVPRSVQVLDVRENTVAMRSPAPTYAVLYARAALRKETPLPEEYIRQTPPLYTLKMFGMTYATIHQLPRPYDVALPAEFGDGLGLRGFSIQQIDSTVVVTPSWNIQQDQDGGVYSFVHVLDAQGQRVAQLDAPIDRGLFPTWQAGQQFGVPLPIALPAGLPAGDYRVVLGTYRMDTGERLPLRQGTPLPAEVDGPNALLLTTIKLP